jgi:hypothetical protein
MKYSKNAPPIHLVTDVCVSSIAGKLSQGDDWRTAPVIAFYSAKLSPTQQNYTVTEIEMLGGLETMISYRNLLLGVPFTWYTDHQALKHLLKQRELNPQQSRWMAKLAEFDFKIVYVPGKENVLSDALSRMYSADAPGTIRSSSEYAQHDETCLPLHVAGVAPVVKVGLEAEALMKRDIPVNARPATVIGGRILCLRTQAPKPAPPKPVAPKPAQRARKKATVADAPVQAEGPAEANAEVEVTPAKIPRRNARVVEPAETGRPETAKEIVKCIKRVVLKLPQERLEGGIVGGELGPATSGPHKPSEIAESPEITTDHVVSADHVEGDYVPEPTALIGLLPEMDGLDFVSAIRGKYKDDKLLCHIFEQPKDYKNFSVVDEILYLKHSGNSVLCVPDCQIGI